MSFALLTSSTGTMAGTIPNVLDEQGAAVTDAGWLPEAPQKPTSLPPGAAGWAVFTNRGQSVEGLPYAAGGVLITGPFVPAIMDAWAAGQTVDLAGPYYMRDDRYSVMSMDVQEYRAPSSKWEGAPPPPPVEQTSPEELQQLEEAFPGTAGEGAMSPDEAASVPTGEPAGAGSQTISTDRAQVVEQTRQAFQDQQPTESGPGGSTASSAAVTDTAPAPGVSAAAEIPDWLKATVVGALVAAVLRGKGGR